MRAGTLLFALRGRADGGDLVARGGVDGCAGCGLGGLESELLPERRGVTFEEEAVSAGTGSVVCCSSGAALGRAAHMCGEPNSFHSFAEFVTTPRKWAKATVLIAQATGGKPVERLVQV